jgi:hypothetical protein
MSRKINFPKKCETSVKQGLKAIQLYALVLKPFNLDLLDFYPAKFLLSLPLSPDFSNFT